MAYEKLELENGDVLTAEHIAHIEQGIIENEKAIASVTNGFTDGNEVDY